MFLCQDKHITNVGLADIKQVLLYVWDFIKMTFNCALCTLYRIQSAIHYDKFGLAITANIDENNCSVE